MKAELKRASVDMTRNHDMLLVVGDGDCMRQDLDRFLSWQVAHDASAVGRAIKEYPGYVRHWFCGDGDLSIWWARNLTNGNGTIKHTLGEIEAFDADWDMIQDDYKYGTITGEGNLSRIHGTSALFATLAGLALGYEKIILAGCPLDMNGHYYWPEKNKETLGPIWMGTDFMAWLDFAGQEEARKVRSMGGYTAKMIGAADKEWASAVQ